MGWLARQDGQRFAKTSEKRHILQFTRNKTVTCRATWSSLTSTPLFPHRHCTIWFCCKRGGCACFNKTCGSLFCRRPTPGLTLRMSHEFVKRQLTTPTLCPNDVFSSKFLFLWKARATNPPLGWLKLNDYFLLTEALWVTFYGGKKKSFPLFAKFPDGQKAYLVLK